MSETSKQSLPGRDHRGRFTAGNPYSSIGGRSQKAKHPDKLSQWGKLGFQAFADRHFKGDRAAAKKWLSDQGVYWGDPYREIFPIGPPPPPCPMEV